MSFLHSEQPKCHKILPPFQSRKCHFSFFLLSLTVNLRTQSAPYHNFLLEVAPHPSNSVHWKSLLGLAWLSCAGLDLGPAAESRAKGLESVSSSLRTDQKRFALPFSFTFDTDFSILITTGDISNQETSPRRPPLVSQPVVPNSWGEEVCICPG